jgi:hypothetical protein
MFDMAYKKEKELAITLRKQGMSYSQIREKVHVSKSTLSLWLEDYPLTKERLHELRSTPNSHRIESYRATMKKKQEEKITIQEKRVTKDMGKLSRRDLFVSGFFLFWGEGAKGRRGEVALANTDPSMIRYFIDWIILLGGEKEKFYFTLHIYADMDPQTEITYWAKELDVRKTQFWKPYIKKTNLSGLSYRNGFGHGTCNARYMSQEMNDYVLMGWKALRRLYEKA